MSEEQNNKDLPVADKGKTEVASTEEKKLFSRRQALLGALFGAGAVLAKAAQATEASCACLAPPDCDEVCVFGGNPRGDGTQACDCNTEPVRTDTSSLDDIITAGSAGLATDLSFNREWLRTTTTYRSSTRTVTSQVTKHPTGSIQIPFFTVDSKGRITAYTTHTVTLADKITDQAKYDNYYNYSNYYDYYDNCGDDSNCFIEGKLLTTEGPKEVQEIRVGDVLLGDDGEHKVLGIKTGKLGTNRFAEHPVNDLQFILTADHVISENGEFVIVSKDYFKPNRNLMQSPTVKGTYDFEGLFEKCVEKPESFVKVSRFAPDTRTYSFIVDKGLWGKTEGGTSVLLAHVVKED